MAKVEEKISFRGFLGIDISKDKFDACCIGIGGEKHPLRATVSSKKALPLVFFLLRP